VNPNKTIKGGKFVVQRYSIVRKNTCKAGRHRNPVVE